MMRHIVSALLAVTSHTVPAFAQTQPARPATPSPRVVIEQQRAIERAQARERQRDNRVEQTERVNHLFKVGGSGELRVANLIGDITIVRGGNEIRVEAIKTVRARTETEARELLPAVRVEFTERAGRADVKVHYPSEHFGRSNQRNVSVAVAYSITAPQGTRIDVNTLAGNIRVTGIKGELSLASLSGNVSVFDGARIQKATSTSGNVEIRDLQSDAPVEARSTSGRVTVAQSRAPRIEIGSISGAVTIDNVQTEQIEAQSLSGDVTAAFPFAENGRYELNSHSGTVRITLMNDTGFDLDANSFSGDVRSGVTLIERPGGATQSGRRGPARRVRGRFGDGTALLDITTFSGDIIITKK